MDAVMLDAALVPLLDTMPEFSFTAEVLPAIREGPGLDGARRAVATKSSASITW